MSIRKLKHTSHKKMDSPYMLKPLELIHMDLMDRIKTESLGGKHYIFLTVDNCSRFSMHFSA